MPNDTHTPVPYYNSHVVFCIFTLYLKDQGSYFLQHMDSAQLLVVGNKCHLEEYREVTREEGEMMAASIGATFFEVSAKTGVNIDEVCSY